MSIKSIMIQIVGESIPDFYRYIDNELETGSKRFEFK